MDHSRTLPCGRLDIITRFASKIGPDLSKRARSMLLSLPKVGYLTLSGFAKINSRFFFLVRISKLLIFYERREIQKYAEFVPVHAVKWTSVKVKIVPLKLLIIKKIFL